MRTLHHATEKKAQRKGYHVQYGVHSRDEGSLLVFRNSDGGLAHDFYIPLDGSEREQVKKLVDEL